LDALSTLCQSDLERIKIALLRMRQYIAAARLPEAMSLCWSTLEAFGYDPHGPTAHAVHVPRTIDEVNRLVVPTDIEADDPPDMDIQSVVLTMLGE
jgi:hypothetical protein